MLWTISAAVLVASAVAVGRIVRKRRGTDLFRMAAVVIGAGTGLLVVGALVQLTWRGGVLLQQGGAILIASGAPVIVVGLATAILANVRRRSKAVRGKV